MNLKERSKKLKTDIPAIFIALRKRETPVPAKILAGLTIAYALSPIDLIPDFIPVLGYLDDLIILPAMVVLTIKFIPEHILQDCRTEAENLWKDGKPKKWYYAVPILLLWALIIFFILRAVF
jgi:uncharacterized membrane protein YkvA (DUF1232 family)